MINIDAFNNVRNTNFLTDALKYLGTDSQQVFTQEIQADTILQ